MTTNKLPGNAVALAIRKNRMRPIVFWAMLLEIEYRNKEIERERKESIEDGMFELSLARLKWSTKTVPYRTM